MRSHLRPYANHIPVKTALVLTSFDYGNGTLRQPLQQPVADQEGGKGNGVYDLGKGDNAFPDFWTATRVRQECDGGNDKLTPTCE